MPERHKSIAPTAHYTAYVWHRLGMPHAGLFATGTGATLYWTFRVVGEWATVLSRRVPTMEQYLEYRHRLIEAHLRRFEPDVVVEIGAGLSRRGVTFAGDHGLPYLEIDLPHMIEHKRSVLERDRDRLPAGTMDRLRLVAADALAPDFGERLRELLGNARKPAFVAEGVVSYFELDERERLMRSIVAGSRGAGEASFVCDLHTREAQARVAAAARVLKLAIRTVTRGQGGRTPYDDLAHARRHFLECGFADAGALEAAAHVDLEPRLAEVFSPASIFAGHVGG